MTPKAQDLVDKFRDIIPIHGADSQQEADYNGVEADRAAKQCALIAVDEMKTYLDIWINSLASEPEMDKMKSDWQALGDEIEKL